MDFWNDKDFLKKLVTHVLDDNRGGGEVRQNALFKDIFRILDET